MRSWVARQVIRMSSFKCGFVAALSCLFLSTRALAQPPILAEDLALTELLSHSDGGPGHQFGTSVAVDGDTAVVTASNAGQPALGGIPKVFVLKRVSGTWTPVARLRPSDGADSHMFVVAIEGDTVVVGANYGPCGGRAYVFVKPQGGWIEMTETAVLTASDGMESDLFGEPVAISGDTIAVGAPDHDNGQGSNGNSGTVYVFEKPATGWVSMTQTAKLSGLSPHSSERVGRTVSISGDTIVAGAWPDIPWGRLYVFEKPASGWTDMLPTATLTGPGAQFGSQFQFLGLSVAIYNDTIIGGCINAACVFVRPPAGWLDASPTAALTSSDGADLDFFGIDVALRSDVAVVGAYANDGAPNPDRGAAYVYIKPVNGWVNDTETAKLTASNGQAEDYFGYSIAMTDTTILCGAYGADSQVASDAGRVYVFEEPVEGWSTSSESGFVQLSENGDITQGDEFGFSVDIEGDVAVVGVPLDDTSVPNEGSAIVFARVKGTWTRQAKLTAADPLPGRQLGWSVAVSKQTVVLGVGGGANRAAYVYLRPESGWADMTQTAKLTTTDGNWISFGSSVGISAETIVVGAPDKFPGGRAYVFVRPQGGWADMTQTARLSASDIATGDQFGWSVSVSSDVVAVGSPLADHGQPSYERGAVYVFVRPPSGWMDVTETAKLTAISNPGSRLGSALALDGDTIVAGAPSLQQWPHPGGAFVFVKPVDGWVSSTQAASLTASSISPINAFGASVSISEDIAVVGTRAMANGPEPAFVYVRPESGWEDTREAAALVTSYDEQDVANLPTLAISGATVLRGVPDDDGPSGSGQGAVYSYSLHLGDCNTNGVADLVDVASDTSADADENGVPDECDPPCLSDLNGDAVIDVKDLLAAIEAWGVCPGPLACSADVNNDSVIDMDDLLLVVGAWGPCG